MVFLAKTCCTQDVSRSSLSHLNNVLVVRPSSSDRSTRSWPSTYLRNAFITLSGLLPKCPPNSISNLSICTFLSKRQVSSATSTDYSSQYRRPSYLSNKRKIEVLGHEERGLFPLKPSWLSVQIFCPSSDGNAFVDFGVNLLEILTRPQKKDSGLSSGGWLRRPGDERRA